MACSVSRLAPGANHTGRRAVPKIKELVNDCQEELLPAIRRWLAVDLQICLSEARFCLDNAQGTVDGCVVIQKKPEEREKIPYSKRWMRKGERVHAVTNICVTAGMANDFRRLALNDPFRRLHMEEFHTLTENLKQLIEELQKRNGEINESLRIIKRSRKAWNAVFITVSIGVQVCSLLLAALVAPLVAVPAGTTAGTVIKTALELWIGSIWERQKGALKEEKQVIEMVQDQLQVSLYDDLQSIESLVQMVKSDYGALAVDMELLANPQHDEEEALKKRLKEVMAKFNGGKLKAAISSLDNKVDECYKTIRQGEEALRFVNIKPRDQ